MMMMKMVFLMTTHEKSLFIQVSLKYVLFTCSKVSQLTEYCYHITII
jgi:hypothetical protein